jgi:hypothetical protein
MGFPLDREASLRAVLDALAERPDDPYWCRRLIEEAPPAGDPEMADWLVHAFVTWASYDPAWFVSADFYGLTMSPLAFRWHAPLLERIEREIDIADDSLRHLVLGRLWMSAKSVGDDAFARRAAKHFDQVDSFPTRTFARERAEALFVADPARLLTEAPPEWRLKHDWRVAASIRTVLGAAMRVNDWEAYAKHRAAYGAIESRADLDVLHCDGLRALHFRDDRALRRVLVELADRGKNVAHLSSPHCIQFAEDALAHGKHLPLLRAYVADLHACQGSDLGAKLLARIDARMRRTRRKRPVRAKKRPR